jgi:epoxyqueuosine reductase
MHQIDEILKRYLLPAKNYIYGFADLTGLIDKKYDGYNWCISIGRKLDSAIVDGITRGPTMEYYSHYRQINEDLSSLMKKISDDLSRNNFESIVIDPTVSTAELDTIYFKTLRTDFPHKMAATRAGLGWIGKTDLFISTESGPRLRLVSILLNTPLEVKSKSIDKSRCGTCNLCVDICPAKAANGKLWDISIEREEFYDPWKCRDKCTEFGRSRLGKDARVCGMCVAVCPIGR